jgi:hypothetical protein
MFCRAFGVENIADSSVSYDALIPATDADAPRMGIGLKTFVMPRWSDKFEKVAEFNREFRTEAWNRSDNLALAKRVATLRNTRIRTDALLWNVNEQSSVYHCVARGADEGRSLLKVFEVPYPVIHVDDVRVTEESASAIKFHDGENTYSFHLSKSTLYKRFLLPANCSDLAPQILPDPLSALLDWYSGIHPGLSSSSSSRQADAPVSLAPGQDYVVLPLYSTRSEFPKVLPPKSGLNAWNADGRLRDFGTDADGAFGEVYLPFPAQVRNKFRSFFPPREQTFDVRTPSGHSIPMTVCQENDKAIASNPNKALSHWLFSVFAFRPASGAPLTYEHLKTSGKDSVRITRASNGQYSITLAHLGAYEEFLDEVAEL